MSAIAANVFMVICRLSNPYECEFLVDLTRDFREGATPREIVDASVRRVDPWVEEARPGYYIARAFVRFVDESGT